jgi:uncharacterized membrane protein YphA (DoxX/SURF4 family)
MNVPFLIGRLVYGGFFVYNGISHFKERKMMAQYAASKNVPEPEAGVIGSGVLLLLGGASVMLGLKPKLGTAAIIAFLAGVTPVMHDFWRQEDQGQRMNEMIHFCKNTALFGAALALMGVEEPWPASPSLEEPTRTERVVQFARRLAA